MSRRSLADKLLSWSRFIPMYIALRVARRGSRNMPLERAPEPWGQGISALIPESGTPELLAGTLAHITAALEQVSEPTEVVVMINGAPLESYADLRQRFPKVVWLHDAKALGFSGAIERGLEAVTLPSVYLLNSDMRVEPDAIAQLLPYRMPGTFALGSQIFFADAARRREETGWCDYYVQGTRPVIYDKDPGTSQIARGSLYAGGGSALFRTALLRHYVSESRAYSPFYWEDADWGVRAWAEGLECLFVPASVAVHEHRGTIKRRFAKVEIDRIVDRNALLFEMRHHFTDMDGIRATGHLAGQLPQTQKELCSPFIAREVARLRAQSDAVKARGFRFEEIVNKYYMPPRPELPIVLWVTPFAIFPPAHGGARRIVELARRLAPHVNLLLLSDERVSYAGSAPEDFACFQSAHLLQARGDKSEQKLQDLITRMEVHAPEALRYELRRLQRLHRVDLVQVEFMEATQLVDERAGETPFVAALHDVYLDGSAYDHAQREVLARYDAVVTCSEEDAAHLAAIPHQVVANGAPDRFDASAPSAGKRILFMGPFRYEPNRLGIIAFLKECWPAIRAEHPDAELVILAGADALKPQYSDPLLRQDGVTLVSAFVDPMPYLADCALSINPQQEIRGSALKVAESLLARRVCVTTRNGARGFTELRTAALRIAHDWPAMTAAINELLGDAGLRHAAEAGAETVRQHLSWDGRAAELLALYQRLLPHAFRKNSA